MFILPFAFKSVEWCWHVALGVCQKKASVNMFSRRTHKISLFDRTYAVPDSARTERETWMIWEELQPFLLRRWRRLSVRNERSRQRGTDDDDDTEEEEVEAKIETPSFFSVKEEAEKICQPTMTEYRARSRSLPRAEYWEGGAGAEQTHKSSLMRMLREYPARFSESEGNQRQPSANLRSVFMRTR